MGLQIVQHVSYLLYFRPQSRHDSRPWSPRDSIVTTSRPQQLPSFSIEPFRAFLLQVAEVGLRPLPGCDACRKNLGHVVDFVRAKANCGKRFKSQRAQYSLITEVTLNPAWVPYVSCAPGSLDVSQRCQSYFFCLGSRDATPRLTWSARSAKKLHKAAWRLRWGNSCLRPMSWSLWLFVLRRLLLPLLWASKVPVVLAHIPLLEGQRFWAQWVASSMLRFRKLARAPSIEIMPTFGSQPTWYVCSPGVLGQESLELLGPVYCSASQALH